MATITGSNATDILDGTTGNDVINSAGGDDAAFGDTGKDVMRGGDGDDYLEGNGGQDRLLGEDGWDWLAGGAGNDTLNGGSTAPLGYNDGDTVAYFFEGGGSGVTVNLATGNATDTFGNADTLIDIERVVGSEFADRFIGSDATTGSAERFRGFQGADTIDGGAGFDIADYARDYYEGGGQGIIADLAAGTVRDGFGDIDWISGIEVIRASVVSDDLRGDGLDNVFLPLGGSDFIDGAGGFDMLDYSPDVYIDDENSGTGSRGIQADLATGLVIDTAEWLDTVQNIEGIWGSYFDDAIRGDAAINEFHGGDGEDVLMGRGGEDYLYGDLGQDRLKGGAANDWLFGGEGDDDLRGGAGSDIFVFDKLSDDDVIHRFATGSDKLDVSDFGFATKSDVLAKITETSRHTAFLQLSDDVSVELVDVNTGGAFLTANDIII